jgi:hypothetical protein
MDDFARLYPDNSNLDLSARFAVSIHTVVAWAAKLGLRKSQRYRRGVQRANASRRRLTPAQRQHSYRCRACGRLCRKYEKGLAAHHLASYSAWPDLRFDITNGITLCRSCHMAIHQRPIEPRTLISCARGCGMQIPNRDVYGRARRYVNFHGARGKPKSETAKAKLRAKRVGRALTPEHRAKISMGLRSSAKRIGRPPNRG